MFTLADDTNIIRLNTFIWVQTRHMTIVYVNFIYFVYDQDVYPIRDYNDNSSQSLILMFTQRVFLGILNKVYKIRLIDNISIIKLNTSIQIQTKPTISILISYTLSSKI